MVRCAASPRAMAIDRFLLDDRCSPIHGRDPGDVPRCRMLQIIAIVTTFTLHRGEVSIILERHKRRCTMPFEPMLKGPRGARDEYSLKTRQRRDVCTPTRCSLQVKKLPAYTAETSIRTTLKLSHGEMMAPEPVLRNRFGVMPTCLTCQTNRLSYTLFDPTLRSTSTRGLPGQERTLLRTLPPSVPRVPVPMGAALPAPPRRLFQPPVLASPVSRVRPTGRCSIPAGTCSSSRMNLNPRLAISSLCACVFGFVCAHFTTPPFRLARTSPERPGQTTRRSACFPGRTIGRCSGQQQGFPRQASSVVFSALCAASAFGTGSFSISVPGVAMPRHIGQQPDPALYTGPIVQWPSASHVHNVVLVRGPRGLAMRSVARPSAPWRR